MLSTPTPTLFKRGRPLYFYLDKNILIYAESKDPNLLNVELKNWLNKHQGHFFVTPAVRKEYHERLPEGIIYLQDKIDERSRFGALEEMRIKLNLDEAEKKKFAADLNIVVEASASRWRNTLIPIEGSCYLLTRNLAFWNRCLNSPGNENN
eukprot:TRINITY_DN4231_c0_g1_i5.p1 TRINITY_DN4231_c0_g1~~TRINITY_DN4231_c0_g1_i5.p1  ORF type:complete len:151 (+),score=11.47 TRINITY_DN4231_c0_g1_i5:26-478(+)